jgi:radical SAM superfamily enzyme YgiQ (UPF0313 family)
MDIALVFPPSTFLTNPLVWPPLGLWYLGAQLEAQGHKTAFYDLSLEKDIPKDGEYDQLWLSGKSAQMYEIKKIAEKTKNWKHTKTVFGGAAPWADPMGCADLPFDLIVAGESDHPDTIREILNRANDFLFDWKPQIFAPFISRDLDWVLPPLRRWNLNYHAYMDDKDGNKYRMASLFTSRGCPMSCAFCESGRHGVIWNALTRYEPLDIVEHQIKEVKDMGFTGLAYYDDIFIVNKKRTYKLLELHQKYDMKFRCFLRSDILSKHGGKDYLKDLQEGGLIEIFIGAESADNQIKENVHKGTTIEQDTDVVRWCKELGITSKVSFIFGLPGESMSSMKKTRQWILENQPDIVQVDRLIPFPGTPLTKNAEEYDLKYETPVEDEWFFRGRHDMDSKSFVSTSHLSVEEIDTFWRNLEKELVAKGLSGYNH